MASELPHDASWEAVARLVFWNRDVSLTAWQNGVLSASRAYLPDSVRWMRPRHFIRFLEQQAFEAQWPRIRLGLDENQIGLARLDLHWSKLTTGTYDADPSSALIPLPAKTREVYNHLVSHQGVSVQELAERLGMSSQGACALVHQLEGVGLVSSLNGSSQEREMRLYTMKSARRQVPRDLLVGSLQR